MSLMPHQFISKTPRAPNPQFRGLQLPGHNAKPHGALTAAVAVRPGSPGTYIVGGRRRDPGGSCSLSATFKMTQPRALGAWEPPKGNVLWQGH